MKLSIAHQERYSRTDLLLRTIFGWLYIYLPHAFLLMFMGIWSSILGFISFWAILFTGRYPQSFYEFQVNLIKWNLRVQARIYNLADGYPAFGINSTDDHTDFQMPYPENLSRGMALVKMMFGWLYCALPHIFVWYFRFIATYVLTFLAFWVVLFTGKYPASWHRFNVGTIRWMTRVNLYLSFMTDKYPPFSGAPEEEEQAAPPQQPEAGAEGSAQPA